MYSNKRFHDITDMEFFLFGGVPETPEPVFERDIQAHSELRRSRGAGSRQRYSGVAGEQEVLESLVISFDSGTLVLEPE